MSSSQHKNDRLKQQTERWRQRRHQRTAGAASRALSFDGPIVRHDLGESAVPVYGYGVYRQDQISALAAWARQANAEFLFARFDGLDRGVFIATAPIPSAAEPSIDHEAAGKRCLAELVPAFEAGIPAEAIMSSRWPTVTGVVPAGKMYVMKPRRNGK